MRAGVNTIIPGELYQRGHMLTWPAEQKLVLLRNLKIGLVVNLWCKVDPDLSKQGLIYLTWPCSPSAVPDGQDLLVDFVAQQVRRGTPTLVACEAGRGRSVWLCARVLVALGKEPGDALAIVRNAVPSAKLQPVLVGDIMAQGVPHW